MSIKWLVLSGIVCLLSPTAVKPAHAELLDGLRLHDYCGLVSRSSELSDLDALHMNECLYFVDGVIAGYEVGNNNPDLCIPTDQGITTGQIGLMVVRYTDQHPERLHVPARYLVIEAMLNGFHCPTKSPAK